ncbi:MAG TPA: phosphonate metabolism protein/1,5-bisphosphokinase (PRPP-forming) PhnN [Hyphomicrobiaceae bacterium]|nr:phosphonate metabolism protein/1,5-bisphosphokinase (PRPP-forming) PhnN [Hyphomicrobiaceae bacterium]
MAGDGSFEDGTVLDLAPGRVVLLVGPSGAGKDAVLREVRCRLADRKQFAFVRRLVTREPGGAEDHDCVSASEFTTRLRQGHFALSWQAHGLQYAIPAEIDEAVRRGECVVFNASRTIVARARARYRNVAVVLIDAPPELRANRLAQRRREQGAELALRLARASDFKPNDADLIIENTGALTAAAEALVDWLEAGEADPPASSSHD